MPGLRKAMGGHFSKDDRGREIRETGKTSASVQVGLMLSFSEDMTALSAMNQGLQLGIVLLTAPRHSIQ